MSEFLALSWQSADPSAAATAAQIVACVRRKPTWRVLVETRGKLVAATEATRYLLSGTPDQSTVVIGDLVDRHGDPCHQLPETGSFRSICQGVASTCWGGYVIVDNDDDAPLSVFRDPIGYCDIVTWNHAGATIVASNPMEWLDDFPPVAMGIDWDRVSVLLRQPALCFEHTPLQVCPPCLRARSPHWRRRSARRAALASLPILSARSRRHSRSRRIARYRRSLRVRLAGPSSDLGSRGLWWVRFSACRERQRAQHKPTAARDYLLCERPRRR